MSCIKNKMCYNVCGGDEIERGKEKTQGIGK